MRTDLDIALRRSWCEHCGVEIAGFHGQRFCGHVCRHRAWRGRPPARIVRHTGAQDVRRLVYLPPVGSLARGFFGVVRGVV